MLIQACKLAICKITFALISGLEATVVLEEATEEAKALQARLEDIVPTEDAQSSAMYEGENLYLESSYGHFPLNNRWRGGKRRGCEEGMMRLQDGQDKIRR